MSWNINDDFEVKYLGDCGMVITVSIGFWNLIKMAFSGKHNVIELNTTAKVIITKDLINVGYTTVKGILKISKGD